MRRDLRGEPQDVPADLRPLGALRTLPAIAMTVIAVGACRSQPAPQPITVADGAAVFREGCDGGVCWTEGRDENGRLLSRHEHTAEGSTTWVYEPPGTLQRIHEVRVLRAADPRRLWVRNTWVGGVGHPDRRETYVWDEGVTTIVVHVEEGVLGERRWRAIGDETRPRDVK